MDGWTDRKGNKVNFSYLYIPIATLCFILYNNCLQVRMTVCVLIIYGPKSLRTEPQGLVGVYRDFQDFWTVKETGRD